MNDLESKKIDMDEKIAALENNDTWDLVPFPEGHKHTGCKWMFKKQDWFRWQY